MSPQAPGQPENAAPRLGKRFWAASWSWERNTRRLRQLAGPRPPVTLPPAGLKLTLEGVGAQFEQARVGFAEGSAVAQVAPGSVYAECRACGERETAVGGNPADLSRGPFARGGTCVYRQSAAGNRGRLLVPRSRWQPGLRGSR
jgi:hypothetical protein